MLAPGLHRFAGRQRIAVVRVLAVDWSGKLKRAEEYLWLADVRDSRLVDLRNGFTRERLAERLVALAEEDARTVVGLDFAFSFPRWWCDQRGWTNGPEVWAAMAEEGEALLAACEEPFWGRPGKPNPHPVDRLYRRTDRDAGMGAAKSIFQIGGAGAVGTGSIRGMPQLLTLAEQDVQIWPFSADGWPRVVEIYPRALTGRRGRAAGQRGTRTCAPAFPTSPPISSSERPGGRTPSMPPCPAS